MGKRNPLSEKAQEMYKNGIPLVDIARELDVPAGTIRRWKSTQDWDKKNQEPESERSGKKGERSGNKRERSHMKDMAEKDGTKETMKNDNLSEKEQLFCVYYIHSFNATQSYKKAYGSSYNVANSEGYKLLVKPCIKKELERLKEIKRQMIVAGEEDFVELQMRIAFSDMGDFAKWKGGSVSAFPSEEVDTQLVKKIKASEWGVSIELKDSQKAMDWLTKYFTMHPEDKYRLEFEKKKAAIKENTSEQILQNMKTIEELLMNPVKNRSIEDLEG